MPPREKQKGKAGEKVKALCALKSGGDYGTDYIDRLAESIKDTNRNIDLVCLSDVTHPLSERLTNHWPSWWSKINLLNPEIVGDGALICDLDTIFIDTLPVPNRLTMLRDFYRPQRLQSGLMYVTADAAAKAWRVFKHDPEGTMQRFRGDGEFLAWLFPHARTWQDDYPGKVVSYKVHCKGGPPDGAAVICYHGRPRPRDTGWAIGH